MKNLQIKRDASPLERNLKMINLALLVVLLLYCGMSYMNLPGEIPIHFNAAGKADGWGSPLMIFLLPLIGWGLFGLMHLISQANPKNFNYPVKITEQNAQPQYNLARDLMQLITLVSILFFGYITWVMIKAAGGGEANLGWAFIILFVAALGGAIGWYLYQAKKLQ